MENSKTMNEFLSAVIEMHTSGRLTQIAHNRVNQHIIENIRIKSKEQRIQKFKVGSDSEGMYKPGDVDDMWVLPTSPVVLWPSQKKGENKNWNFVIAEQNPEEPAFLKLRAVDRSCIHEDFRKSVDKNGYFESTTFITNMLFTCNTFISDNPDKFVRNFKIEGPSLQLPQVKADSTFSYDRVYCLKCQSWPSSIACEYYNRIRPSKWPPQKLLNKILLLDCLVVAVGHHGSASKHTEWRLSFSLAERELIQRMCKPFVNCMYALKLVKNKYIVFSNSDKPTPFCSYFIKTACLWLCETLPNKEYSIINLIKRVLDWLIDSYKNRKMSHYFIPEQNLIGHLSVDCCDDMRAKLTAIMRDIWTVLKTSVDPDHYINQAVCLCSSLNLKIPSVSGDDAYETEESILLNHPIARAFLEQCISLIRNGDTQYKHQIDKCAIFAGRGCPVAFFEIDYLIKQRAFSEILRFPEEIIIPIVEDINEIVPEGYGSMFKVILYRLLGDMYTYLLIYLRNIGYDYPASYKNKPLYYYALGAKMVYLNKWSDVGIGGQALKVKYHYLMGDYETLKKMFNLKPVLSTYKEDDIFMNSICSINIEVYSDIVHSAWGVDKKLQQCFKCSNGLNALMNPIVFIFYVMARVHLREGDLEEASAIVQEMKDCLMKIEYHEMYDFTKSMIEFIEIEIIELRRLLYCSNALKPLERPAFVHILYPPTH